MDNEISSVLNRTQFTRPKNNRQAPPDKGRRSE